MKNTAMFRKSLQIALFAFLFQTMSFQLAIPKSKPKIEKSEMLRKFKAVYRPEDFNEKNLVLKPSSTVINAFAKLTKNVKRIATNYYQFKRERARTKHSYIKYSKETNEDFLLTLRGLKEDGEVEKKEFVPTSSTGKKQNKIILIKNNTVTRIVDLPEHMTGAIVKGESPKGRKTNLETPPTSEPNENVQEPIEESSQTNIPDFHPIKIVFDEGLMYHAISEIIPSSPGSDEAKVAAKKQLILSKIINLLTVADSIIRRYIFISDKNPKTIEISKIECAVTTGTFMREPELTSGGIKVEGDLLVFVDIINDPKDRMIAQAAYCSSRSSTQMVHVGRMTLNLAMLAGENISMTKRFSQVLTVVHEIFHIIAFNNKLSSKFLSNKIEPNLKYLQMLSKSKIRPLVAKTNDHFTSAILPADLMVPSERINASLTVFSLEYIDNISEMMVTNKKFMENNFVMDQIYDFESFLQYKCEDKLPAKYSFYCSKSDKQNKPNGCDPSRLYKNVCSKTSSRPMENNCFERVAQIESVCIDDTIKNMKVGSIEEFGEDSRCFENFDAKREALCLKFQVNRQEIVIKNGGRDFKCTKSNKFVIIKGVKVKCPNIEEFITVYKKTNCEKMCYSNGTCNNGKCFCYEGFDPSTNCKDKLKESGRGTMFVKAAMANRPSNSVPIRYLKSDELTEL
jgi:hypothetical protein